MAIRRGSLGENVVAGVAGEGIARDRPRWGKPRDQRRLLRWIGSPVSAGPRRRVQNAKARRRVARNEAAMNVAAASAGVIDGRKAPIRAIDAVRATVDARVAATADASH